MEEDEDNQNELCPNDMKNKVIAPGAENQNQSMMVLDIHSSPIPPFLLKIYDMLANDDTHAFVSWTPSGTSFVIKDPHSFSTNVLPMYFRHNNFQSFVTQLNSYGFKKVCWEQWEYRNEHFQRGERQLLRNIKRRNQQHQISHHSLIQEYYALKTEVAGLDHKQQRLEEKLASLKCRVASNERDQTRMVSALLQRLLDDDKGKMKMKMKVDEQDMQKHPPCTFISLEDLIGQDCVDC